MKKKSAAVKEAEKKRLEELKKKTLSGKKK